MRFNSAKLGIPGFQQLYNNNPSMNHNFQHFLQAEAAWVMAPVRKGYEDYVGWYMTTGEIWGGGEPPIVDDPHFVSLLSEIKGENFDWESETWETRVPTNLTWLQPGTDLNAY